MYLQNENLRQGKKMAKAQMIGKGRKKGQGSKWIRPEKRLAIYLRDGMACAYCKATVESTNKPLSLDHLIPCAKGGGNHEGNLITCCLLCNSRRGDMDLDKWLNQEFGKDENKVATFIQEHTAKDLKPFKVEAKAIRARRRANK